MIISYDDVIETFYSSFQDKYELADELIERWLKRAVGDFSLKVSYITYDSESKKITGENEDLKDYAVINTLAMLIKKYYQEREYSRVNKIQNIIGKDISLNKTDTTKTHVKNELDYVCDTVDEYYYNQLTPAYS